MTNKVYGNNAKSFSNWLKSRGYTHKYVRERLNENGITTYNDIIGDDEFIEKNPNAGYLGYKDRYGCDRGNRTRSEKSLSCDVGDIQEHLFCIDNEDFKRNTKATGEWVEKDSDINSNSLDLIHIPTGAEVEFKTNYADKMYGPNEIVYYNHRYGHFDEFMRKGNILMIYYVNLNRIAVFDYNSFKDPEYGKNYGTVFVKTKNLVTQYGTICDNVQLDRTVMLDYEMMKRGNINISKKVSEIVRNRNQRKNS